MLLNCKDPQSVKFRFLLLFCLFQGVVFGQSIPEGFTVLNPIPDTLVIDLRYGSSKNFVGKVIDGYENPKAVISIAAANGIRKVLTLLQPYGLGLKIYDSYRPQRAVNHFIRWAGIPADTVNKKNYYPNIEKKDLFKAGYVAERSGHSRGSTLDLTLIDIASGQEVDMGSPWDFFGKRSWFIHDPLTAKQKSNRTFLRTVMQQSGFKPYDKEWWHFTLENEPFPDTYFDFVPQ